MLRWYKVLWLVIPCFEKSPQKTPTIWAYFLKKICSPDLSKIAQSGHTAECPKKNFHLSLKKRTFYLILFEKFNILTPASKKVFF